MWGTRPTNILTLIRSSSKNAEYSACVKTPCVLILHQRDYTTCEHFAPTTSVSSLLSVASRHKQGDAYHLLWFHIHSWSFSGQNLTTTRPFLYKVIFQESMTLSGQKPDRFFLAALIDTVIYLCSETSVQTVTRITVLTQI